MGALLLPQSCILDLRAGKILTQISSNDSYKMTLLFLLLGDGRNSTWAFYKPGGPYNAPVWNAFVPFRETVIVLKNISNVLGSEVFNAISDICNKQRVARQSSCRLVDGPSFTFP